MLLLSMKFREIADRQHSSFDNAICWKRDEKKAATLSSSSWIVEVSYNASQLERERGGVGVGCERDTFCYDVVARIFH